MFGGFGGEGQARRQRCFPGQGFNCATWMTTLLWLFGSALAAPHAPLPLQSRLGPSFAGWTRPDRSRAFLVVKARSCPARSRSAGAGHAGRVSALGVQSVQPGRRPLFEDASFYSRTPASGKQLCFVWPTSNRATSVTAFVFSSASIKSFRASLSLSLGIDSPE